MSLRPLLPRNRLVSPRCIGDVRRYSVLKPLHHVSACVSCRPPMLFEVQLTRLIDIGAECDSGSFRVPWEAESTAIALGSSATFLSRHSRSEHLFNTRQPCRWQIHYLCCEIFARRQGGIGYGCRRQLACVGHLQKCVSSACRNYPLQVGIISSPARRQRPSADVRTVTEVARDVGVSRQTVHMWLAPYQRERA